MELSYTISEQDFIDYNMYFIDHDPVTQKTIRRMQLLLAGLVIVGGAALMYGVGTLTPVSVAVYVALAAGIYAYAPRGFKNKAKKNVRLTIKRAVNKHICGQKLLTADDEGVHLTGEDEDSRYPYDAFARVTPVKRQVYLYLDDISALIVPDNAFSDGAEKEAFVRFLEERIAAAKAAKPAEADGQDESN